MTSCDLLWFINRCRVISYHFVWALIISWLTFITYDFLWFRMMSNVGHQQLYIICVNLLKLYTPVVKIGIAGFPTDHIEACALTRYLLHPLALSMINCYDVRHEFVGGLVPLVFWTDETAGWKSPRMESSSTVEIIQWLEGRMFVSLAIQGLILILIIMLTNRRDQTDMCIQQMRQEKQIRGLSESQMKSLQRHYGVRNKLCLFRGLNTDPHMTAWWDPSHLLCYCTVTF